MKYLLAGALALLSACTVRNLAFLEDAGGGGDLGDGGGPAGDMAGLQPHDLSMGGCVDGTRRCAPAGGPAASQVCKGGTFVNDRVCADSKCADGLCQPPAAGTGTLGDPCDVDQGFGPGPSETICTQGGSTNSCEPFLTSTGEVAWVCGRQVGMGFPGTKCTQGSECRSGFCGTNGYCYRACKGQLDCPQGGPTVFLCVPVDITVEGKKVTANSCAPQ